VFAYGLPIAATLFIWWFSTGAILFLDGLPRRTFRWSMAIASLVAAGAFYGLLVTSGDGSVWGVYLAFLCAMLVWAWNEMAFLMGYVTGSRQTPCPPGAKGLQRFVFATQSILYHEIMILLSGLVIVALTWGGVNSFGLWTFLVLWLMRLSTKFNIFLGVPNTTVDFLPDHLAYLKSYFAVKPMNLLFPLSVSVSTVVAVMIIGKLMSAAPESGMATGYALIATLMALAILEHWFLVIPLPFGELWSWGLSSRTPTTSLHNHEPARPRSARPRLASPSRVSTNDKSNPATERSSVHWESSESRKGALL
jgi:putative photosynthetic complex assembly protein 2